jgi:hypothetical protein
MATIFLSHSSRNDALASALELWLRANGFDDIFVDHVSIRTGDKWAEELRAAKASCRVVICLVTPEWLHSDECYAEFRAAWYMGRRIIALLCLGGGELSEIQASRLSKVNAEDQGADLTKAGAPDGLDLDAPGAAAIAGLLKAGLRAAGALAKIGLDPNAFEIDGKTRGEPFPGLESFGDDDTDAAIFFGRSPEIAECIEDLRGMRALGDRRIYAIQGASGSGKSSLMKAGVLPRLRREPGWLVLRAFRPGADPLLNFADALARTAADYGMALSSGAIRDRLRAASDRLGELDAIIGPLKAKAGRPDATVLIAIDQGEELANAGHDGAASADILAACLKAALAASLGPDGSAPYSIVLTVRSDGFADLQASPRFAGLTTRSADIRTLPVYRFAEAIEAPAARYGVEIEPRLVEALIDDTGGPDALPLLAFTLQRLWRQYQSEKRIVVGNYESVGKLGGLIEDAAERALRGLDPMAPQQPLGGDVPAPMDGRAARIFLPALAQVNDAGAAIRQVARLDPADAEALAVLGPFDRWRLVVRDGDLVEVAHEAMFRTWPRFARWLEPEKARLQVLRGLQTAAGYWNARGRKPDDLVHRGRRLAEARALDRTASYRAQLNDDANARAYIAAAEASQRRRRMVWGVGAAVLAVVCGALAWQTYVYAERVGAELLDRKLLVSERDGERAVAACRLDLAASKIAGSVAMAGQLVRREPSDPTWRYNLAYDQAYMAFILKKRGLGDDLQQSAAALDKARATVAALARIDANDPKVRAARLALAASLQSPVDRSTPCNGMH